MYATTPAELSQSQTKKIFDFLSSHPVGVLATIDPDGNPHASTIYFSVNNDLTVTFTTKRDTDKHKNLIHHNTVMLVAHDATNQTAVQIRGKAIEEIEPETAQKIYYGTLQAAKQTGADVVPPIAKITAGPYVAYTIQLDNIWMSEYGWGDNFAHAMKHAADTDSGKDPA